MRMKRKGWLKIPRSRAVLLAACVCAALCLAVGFTRNPHLYPIDFGQYEAIMRQCGLTWTQEDLLQGDLQYVRPLRFFSYTRFSWASLFTPGAGGSTVYGVALVRLFTQPFGLPFSIDALSAVWALLLIAAAGLITQALYERFPHIWLIPGLMLCLIYMNGNFCAIFRGLYPEAAAIAFSLLSLGLTLRAFSVKKESRSRWIIPVLLSSLLALKSLSPLVVFLPFTAAVNLYLIYSCYRQINRKYLLLPLAAVLLITGLGSAVGLVGSDADYSSEASLYEASFNALLRQTDSPETILREWGLDESYARDIGKSYYEQEEDYAHNPRDPQEAEALFAHVTTGRLAGTYLRHPALFFKAVNARELSMNRGFENGRNSAVSANDKNFTATRVDGGFFSFLWRILPLSWTVYFVIHLLLILAGAGMAIWKKQVSWVLLCLFSLGSILYLPFSLVMDGYAQSQQYMLYQIMLALGLITGLLCAVVEAVPGFLQWMTRYTEDAYRVQPVYRVPSGKESGSWPWLDQARAWVDTVCGNQLLITLFTGLYCFFVLLCVFVPSTHPVSINNGDFGRMMDQMDLTWSGMDYFNTANQANHFAIEEYAYVSGFDALKLTPLKPTYSLYWFVSVVRLLTQPFGLGFSTYLLSWVMGAATVLCILQMVRDLYALLGRRTAAAAALFSVMIMNETYLTWYNSLYGEGCILLGLLMTLACSLHLCVMPRKKSWKRPLWLLGLALSLYIFINAKSQMLMAAPGAIALLLAFCFYHRPYRYDLQAVQGLVALALCGVLAVSSLGVYQSDRTEDSVSQRHTMWQAYFFGIFMISDDPIKDMEDLGVDTAMAPDIGKYVDFSEDAEYVYAPLSKEAEKAFYDHVSMFTIVQWYITHPVKLWYMLDHAAREARELYTGFRVYNGQNYSDPNHDPVNGLNLWPGWRSWLTPGSFLGYVLFYGALLFFLIRRLLRRDTEAKTRILCAVFLFLIVTGVLQYPLSVLGNGFADNQKQLFCFSLCHDLLLGFTVFFLVSWMRGLQNVPKIQWRFRRIEGDAV